MTRTIRIGAALVALASSSLVLTACGPTPVGEVYTTPVAVRADISGTWSTHWGSEEICTLALEQSGDAVSGSYSTTGAPPGSVNGAFDGTVLTGTWTDRAGGGGGMVLTFSADGTSFSGTWGSGDSSSNGGSWTGTR